MHTLSIRLKHLEIDTIEIDDVIFKNCESWNIFTLRPTDVSRYNKPSKYEAMFDGK